MSLHLSDAVVQGEAIESDDDDRNPSEITIVKPNVWFSKYKIQNKKKKTFSRIQKFYASFVHVFP